MTELLSDAPQASIEKKQPTISKLRVAVLAIVFLIFLYAFGQLGIIVYWFALFSLFGGRVDPITIYTIAFLIVVLGIWLFRKLSFRYIGRKWIFAATLFIAALFVVPYVHIRTLRTEVEKENKALETQIQSCQAFFEDTISLKDIKESHASSTRVIQIDATGVFKKSVSISPSAIAKDAKGNEVFYLGWATSTPFEGEIGFRREIFEKFFEAGEHDLRFTLYPDTNIANFRDWTEPRSFTIDKFGFYAENKDLCKWGSSEINAYGPYQTHQYLQEDFLTGDNLVERRKLVRMVLGSRMAYINQPQYYVSTSTPNTIVPSKGSRSGGYIVKIYGVEQGDGDLPVPRIFFGLAEATSVKVFWAPNRHLEATVPPAEKPGTVDVMIAPLNFYPTFWTNAFTYE